MLAQDFPADTEPMIWPAMRLQEAKAVSNGAEITCELLGTTEPAAFREGYVFAGDQIVRDAQPGETCRLSPLTGPRRQSCYKPGRYTWPQLAE